MMTQYELIIVGGGVVGAGLASALSRFGMAVALIDARLPCADDPRLFALNKSSCQFLENIGIWDELSAQAAPIHQVHVSHQGILAQCVYVEKSRCAIIGTRYSCLFD